MTAEDLRGLLARVEACAPEGDRALDLDLRNELTGESWRWREPCPLLNIGEHKFAIFEHEVVRHLKSAGNFEMAFALARQGPCETRFGTPEYFNVDLTAADIYLGRLGLTWSKSFDGWVCVHSDETCTTHRPIGATLPLKLMAGALMHKLALALIAQAAPPP